MASKNTKTKTNEQATGGEDAPAVQTASIAPRQIVYRKEHVPAVRDWAKEKNVDLDALFADDDALATIIANARTPQRAIRKVRKHIKSATTPDMSAGDDAIVTA